MELTIQGTLPNKRIQWDPPPLSRNSNTIANDPGVVKKSLSAYVYKDDVQNFQGFSWQHYSHAQSRLKEKLIPVSIRQKIAEQLDWHLASEDEDYWYRNIYKQLTEKGYTKEIIDLINQDESGPTYDEVRTDVAESGQADDPKSQTFSEAVSNGKDAILKLMNIEDFTTGQFAMGIKQALAWLENNGLDRLDIFTRQDTMLEDQWLHQVLLKDDLGQVYLQPPRYIGSDVIKSEFNFVPDRKYRTVVQFRTEAGIKAMDEGGVYDHSREGIRDRIHHRSSIEDQVNIVTQIEGGPVEWVGNFDEKEVIVGPDVMDQDQRHGEVRVIVKQSGGMILDTGSGMDEEKFSRMMVMKLGDKDPEPLTEAVITEELNHKLRLIKRKTEQLSLSFSRNLDISYTEMIPENIIPESLGDGELVAEFGLLLEVDEDRNSIEFPSSSGEFVSPFQRAIESIVQQTLDRTDLSIPTRLKYVNHLVVGLDAVNPQNAHNKIFMRRIHHAVRQLVQPVIAELRAEGYLILPHDRAFQFIAIPEDKQVIYFHPRLFDWYQRWPMILGDELAAKKIEGLKIIKSLNNQKTSLPVFLVPFKDELFNSGQDQFNHDWIHLSPQERIPMITTELMTIFPYQVYAELYRLDQKRRQMPDGQLDPEDRKLFYAELERWKIVAGDEVDTTYETTPVEAQFQVLDLGGIEVSTGEIDSNQVNQFNAFLVNPTSRGLNPNAPDDANFKYVQIGSNVVEVGTGRVVYKDVKKLTYVFPPSKSANDKALDRTVYVIEADTTVALFDDDKKVKEFKHNGNDYKIKIKEGVLLYTQNGWDIASLVDLRYRDDYSAEDYYWASVQISNHFVTDISTASNNLIIEVYNRFIKNPKQRINNITLSIAGITGTDEISHIQHQDAPIAIIENKTQGFLTVIDLEQGIPLAKKAQAVYVSNLDGKHPFTIIEADFGFISVYDHTDREGVLKDAQDIYFSFSQYRYFDFNKSKFLYRLEFSVSGKPIKLFDDAGYENQDSDVSIFGEHFYFEESSKEYLVNYTIGYGDIYEKLIDKPLARLPKYQSHALVQRHRDEELFIDRTDSTTNRLHHPLNHDRKSTRYQGELLGARINIESDLILKEEPDLLNQLIKFEIRHPQGYYQLIQTENGKTESSNDHFANDDEKRMLLITPVYDIEGSYELDDLSKHPDESEIKISKEKLDLITAKKYPKAHYTGKYFVLEDPKTGDVVYIDPDRPNDLIFVDMPIQTKVFLYEPPSDLQFRANFAQNSDKTWSLILPDGSLHSRRYISIQLYNSSNHFMGMTQSGDLEWITADDVIQVVNINGTNDIDNFSQRGMLMNKGISFGEQREDIELHFFTSKLDYELMLLTSGEYILEKIEFKVDEEGIVRKKILFDSSYVPSGYRFVSSNGNYFVFYNDQQKSVIYLDPRRIEQIIPYRDLSAKDRQIWQKQILPHREQLVKQTQSIYQPVYEDLARIFSEYLADMEKILQPIIKKLYKSQAQGIWQEFHLDGFDGENVARSPNMIFIMKKHQQLIPYFLNYLKGLNQNDRFVSMDLEQQKVFLGNVVRGFLELVINSDVEVSSIVSDTSILNYGLFDLMGYGWAINSQADLDNVRVMGQLLDALYQFNSFEADGQDLQKLIMFLSRSVQIHGSEQHRILNKQLQRILNLKDGVRRQKMEALLEAFRDTSLDVLVEYLEKPETILTTEPIGLYVAFLTTDVREVRVISEEEQQAFIPKGDSVIFTEAGVGLGQIQRADKMRVKTEDDKKIMSLDYLINNWQNMPLTTVRIQNDLGNDVNRGEPGGHTRESAANAADANATELKVDYLLRKAEDGSWEFIEEIQDNGEGAEEELALLLRKSTKSDLSQIDITGFFGSGKFSDYRDADRIHLINNNGERGTFFDIEIIRNDAREFVDARLVQLITFDPTSRPRGLTKRIIKKVAYIEPQLEQMASMRAWKTFTGLAQTDHFKIMIRAGTEEFEPLVVENFILAENRFAGLPRDANEPFQASRTYWTKDMPPQAVTEERWRVRGHDPKHLSLLPKALHRYVQEFGINKVIPLHQMTQSRKGFQNIRDYDDLLSIYYAIEMYQSLAKMVDIQKNPQFVFPGYPEDWLSSTQYNHSFSDTSDDRRIVELAIKINNQNFAAINRDDLDFIRDDNPGAEWRKRYVKLILLLKMYESDGKPQYSLLEKRLRIQIEAFNQDLFGNRRALDEQIKFFEKMGLQLDLPSLANIDNAQTHMRKTQSSMRSNEDIQHAEDFVLPRDQYDEDDIEFVKYAYKIARLFGVEQVILMTPNTSFAGAFKYYEKKLTMFLSQSLVSEWGESDHVGMVDEGTNTIDHELGHLLELITRDGEMDWNIGFEEVSNFTHDRVGTFADAMKYIAYLWSIDLAKKRGDLEMDTPLLDIKTSTGGVDLRPLNQKFELIDLEGAEALEEGLSHQRIYDVSLEQLFIKSIQISPMSFKSLSLPVK